MTPPVLLPAAVAVAAVALGLLLGLAPSGRAQLVGPLRSFALAAALTVVLTHLLPEAFSDLGAPGLLLFAATVAVPGWTRLLARLAGSSGRHEHTALGLGYLGLLAHHVGDGLGLGAYGDVESGAHVDVLLALAVHTVPLVAVVTFAFRAKGGVRPAILAGSGLALASVVGVGASALVPAELVHTLSGWIAAGVSALLVHVVTHDLGRDLPATAGARIVDLAAAALGVWLCLLGSTHGTFGGEIGLGGVVSIELSLIAPALALAALAATLLGRIEHPTVRRWLDPLPGPAFGLDGALAGAAFGGPRFGLLYFAGLLLVTRAVALGAGAIEPRPVERPRLLADLLGRIALLAPWAAVGIVLSAIMRLAGLDLSQLGPIPQLPAALFVALPSGMGATTAVLLASALASQGLAPSVALAFAVIAATRLPTTEGATRSRARALWALVATLLVGVGIGMTPTGPITLVKEPPEWATLAALAVLVPTSLAVLFQLGIRGLLLSVFPSHDSAPTERSVEPAGVEHHHRTPKPS